MNVNGLNFFLPSVQAEEVHVSLVDTVSVRVPGSKGKRLSLGTDIGLTGAIGLSPIEDDTSVHSTSWNLALKFANASKQPIVIETLQARLHENGDLQLVSDPDLTTFYTLALDNTVIPDTTSRNHQNILPILLPGESEKSYWVQLTLRLYQRRLFRKDRFIALPLAAIKEPETYRHYFNTCDLKLQTSAGLLKVTFRVPLFAGDTLRIPKRR